MMTNTELKRSLVAKINEVNDPAFLKALLVIVETQAGLPGKMYHWREPAARKWTDSSPKPAMPETLASENFFEDMEELLREN